MKDKKNGIGTTSPVVETKDYWTGKLIENSLIRYEITSGDLLFKDVRYPVSRKHILTETGTLLINALVIFRGAFWYGKTIKGCFLKTTDLAVIRKIAKTIYEYKTIKEKSSDKTRVVGKRKE